MPVSRVRIVVLFVALVAVLLGIILIIDPQETGFAVANIRSPPQSQKYCSGPQEGIEACFAAKDGLKAFRCEKYYWVPLRETSLRRCCRSYAVCSRTGLFRFSSYCDLQTHTCKLR